MEGGRAERDWSAERLVDVLRERVLGGIHTGRLDTGDRLPSYREVTEQTGVTDLRTIARAYGVLEREGLVEVRGRSGVFVAQQERLGGGIPAEAARWAARVAREAWTRRLPVPELAAFLARCTAMRKVRCAFVESTADQTEAFCAELRNDFGFDAMPVHADRFSPVNVDGTLLRRIPEEVRTADLLATTAFHAAEMRAVADELGKPLVIVRLNRAFTQAVHRQLEAGELTVLCVDPRFVERLKLVAGDPYAERVIGVLATDHAAVARIAGPVLISEAARLALRDVPLPPSFPDEPMLSSGSADEFAEVMVRLNLEAPPSADAQPS